MRDLVAKASGQLVRQRFTDIPALKQALYASLVDYLECRGVIQNRPFEERICPDASLADLDPDAVAGFVRQARAERQFPLSEQAAIQEVLTHLGLLSDSQPSNAAVLLFGKNPQRFFPCAEVRCMHFHTAPGSDLETRLYAFQIGGQPIKPVPEGLVGAQTRHDALTLLSH
jgi:hypothetical protein